MTTPKVGEFGGPVNHGLERPSAYGANTPRGEFPAGIDLPLEAEYKGWKIWNIRAGYDYSPNLYVLYDRWGVILHEWPEDYDPSHG